MNKSIRVIIISGRNADKKKYKEQLFFFYVSYRITTNIVNKKRSGPRFDFRCNLETRVGIKGRDCP